MNNDDLGTYALLGAVADGLLGEAQGLLDVAPDRAVGRLLALAVDCVMERERIANRPLTTNAPTVVKEPSLGVNPSQLSYQPEWDALGPLQRVPPPTGAVEVEERVEEVHIHHSSCLHKMEEDQTARNRYYIKRPHYCRACDGWGFATLQDGTEIPCATCRDHSECPGCREPLSHQHPVFCLNCGWHEDAVDRGMPDGPKCICRDMTPTVGPVEEEPGDDEDDEWETFRYKRSYKPKRQRDRGGNDG